MFTNYILKSKLFLGIPTIIFEGFDTYDYEDCFAMHHFYVSTAVAIAGCAKLNNDKLKPILVSEDRSGQLLQQKIRNSITDMDEHLFCGSKHYDYTRSCDANEKLDCERWTPRNWWVRYLLKRHEKNILGKT